MEYALEIPIANIQQHVDLEKEIQTKKNGLLTFTIRLAGGKIVDLSLLEYVEIRREPQRVITTELAITRIVGTGNQDNAVWGNDG